MNVFLWEALCAGAVGDASPSLLAEGRAMLAALMADMLRINDCRIATIAGDTRLANELRIDDRVTVHIATDPQVERTRFLQLAAECDRTWIIAPEIDDCLAERTRLAQSAGGRVVGSTLEAIELASDKLATARHLETRGIPTIETRRFDASTVPAFPCVIKPRHGAGSIGVRLFEDSTAWREVTTAILRDDYVIQPFIAGTQLSIAALIDRDSITTLPIARQRLSDDGRFTYLGGRIGDASDMQPEADALVRRVCNSLPGLAGYVGVDLIHSDTLRVVEINPRLTTSYVGYRQLTNDNLARRVLLPGDSGGAIGWLPKIVEYEAAGFVSSKTQD